MSTIEITKRMAEASPVPQTKVVLAYYLLSVATGVFFFFVHGAWGFAGDLVAAVIYLTGTALFCGLSVYGLSVYGLSVGTVSRYDNPRARRDP